MKIDYLNNAITALENLMRNGVEEHLEIEYSCSIVEDCLEHLKAVQNFEPDNSESPEDFERNGGNGLTDRERNM